MMRWMILAVVVVALTATATVVVQSVTSDSSVGVGPAYPVASKSSATGEEPAAQSRIVVDGELTYKFGTKAQRTTFAKDWTIANQGKGPLTLRLEAPACSCTVANFQGKDGKSSGTEIEVPPGGTVPIHFTWETRTYTGKYRKPVGILTNDPEHPRLEFAAEGEVQPAVVVYPDPTIEFLEVSTDEESHNAGVAVFSPDRPEFTITKLTSSRPDLVIVTKELLTPTDCKALKTKAGYRVLVDVRRGLPLGVFREEVVVATDHPNQPEVRLTVMGKTVGPVTVVPERLRLHDVSSSTGQSRPMTLLVRGQRETKFTVAHAPANFKVEVVPGENSATAKARNYRLNVTVLPGAPAGSIEDLIILKTDHPQAAEVRIPVNVIVRDPS